MTLEEALREALDDEFRARATYRAVLRAFGDVRPFVNIVESEERHIVALLRLFERYDLALPADPWPARVAAPASFEAACQAAVDAERENAALYARLLEAAAGRPDVVQTFQRLLAASQENHLPAFERALERARRGAAGRGPQREAAAGGAHRHRHRHRGGRCAHAGRDEP